MSSLELRHIEKSYGEYHALKDIQLDVQPGEFVVMVGPSGCGKSTLLKVIAGLEDIRSGEVRIGGRDVTREEPSDRGIAMVFQSYALYPHMTVAQNMGFGLLMAKRPKSEIDAAVRRAAEILRLTDQLDKLPRQLSGGQRQRVAIGRAITRSPEVFLFDEPLSNLDAALRTQMRVELSSLHAQLGATMIYVTHDQVEAMTMADRIVVMNGGHIEQVGAPLELYRNPVNHFVAGFLGAPRMNFFTGTVKAISSGLATIACDGITPFPVALNGNAAVGDQVTIGLRPEGFRIAKSGDALVIKGVVQLREQLGRETILYVDVSPLKTVGSDTGTTHVTVHIPEVTPLKADAPIDLTFNPEDVYVFEKSGRTLTTPKTV